MIMACFLIPTAEAVVASVAVKALEKKERSLNTASDALGTESGRLPFSRKLKWLTRLLWGGAALLAFEHVWHGEVVPWFPFLTNASTPESASEMLHEMGTAGVGMAVLVTVIWLGMLAVSRVIEKRTGSASDGAEQGARS